MVRIIHKWTTHYLSPAPGRVPCEHYGPTVERTAAKCANSIRYSNRLIDRSGVKTVYRQTYASRAFEKHVERYAASGTLRLPT